MNPFSDIIDTTRVRPSILYSPSTVQKLVENLRAENNDDSDRRKTQTDENHGNYAMKLNKSSSNSDGEVYELLARLKQLVGDVNVNPILEQLNLRKQKDCATLSEQPLTLDDKNLSKEVVCTEPNKKTKLNARFALSSPKVIQDTGSNVFDDEIDDDFPSGNSTMRTEEYSRYSLGSNRFSKRASQLSSEILTYVNGNKLLRTTSRSTLLPPDPYACLSPSKGRLIKAHSTSVIPIPSETLVVDSPPENENFQEFSIIGVQSDMLCGLKSLELTSLQPTEVSSAFPADVGRQAIVSNLNEYCFPYGAELRYVNRKELDQLNALSKSDVNASGTAFHNSTHSYGLKYQIMQFTDMEGTVYYATCVISSEPLERVSPQLHANMEVLQNNIAASNMIKRYFTFFLHKKKMRENDALTAKWVSNIAKSRVNSIMTTSAETEGSSADSKGTKKTSIFKVFKRVIGIATKGNGGAAALNSSTSGGSNSEAGKGQSPVSGATRPRKLNGDGKFVSPVGSPLLRQRSRSLCEGGLRTSSADSDSSGVFAEVHVDGSPSKGKISARQINQSNKKVALLTQKAYCIISSQPLHSLFFQVLEAIALKERDRALMRWSCLSISSGGTALAARDSHKDGMFKDMIANQVIGSSSASACAHTAKRNKFLAQLQGMDLSRISKATETRRSVVSYNGKLIDIGDQSYINALKVMPRALTLREWSTAILISLIPSELIVKIHSLLLQEQSLLVYGEDPGMVTAIATAFMMLLQPFTWEGIFVPLLPTAAYEALDAPVPYIIGVVGKSRPAATITSSAGVLSLDDFIRHPEYYVPSCFDEATLRHTLATREDPNLQLRRSRARHDLAGDVDMGLKYFESPCPEETTQGVAPLLDPMQCSQLKELHQLIGYHAVKIKVCLRSVQNNRVGRVLTSTTAIKAVLNDLNDEALRSLTSVLASIHAYNSSLCGEVLTQPGGWRQFGVLNSRSNQFEFLPDLFMGPLKANLRLQESVINTQLFVSFMDQQSVTYLKHQPQRIFLSDWLYFRMYRKRKTHKRRTTRLHLY